MGSLTPQPLQLESAGEVHPEAAHGVGSLTPQPLQLKAAGKVLDSASMQRFEDFLAESDKGSATQTALDQDAVQHYDIGGDCHSELPGFFDEYDRQDLEAHDWDPSQCTQLEPEVVEYCREVLNFLELEPEAVAMLKAGYKEKLAATVEAALVLEHGSPDSTYSHVTSVWRTAQDFVDTIITEAFDALNRI